MTTDDFLNGTTTGYSIGLPVFVDVEPDGSVTFTVDLSESDDPDDLSDAQAHLPEMVREALASGRYTVRGA